MLEKVSLFTNKRDYLHFAILIFTLFALSIALEFHNYKELTKFDSQLVNATVVKQYSKTKQTKTGKIKTYQVLKLTSDKGFSFYTTANSKLPDIRYSHVELEVWAGKISFYDYMRSFYCFSKIIHIHPNHSIKTKLNSMIDAQHTNRDISLLYQALYTAKTLPYELQTLFSSLGVSHLIAISGFHLGVLAAVLFFLIKFPYTFLQKRYFPYRSAKVDSFFIIVSLLLVYLLFLDTPPSLLRAFVMLVIGFILYDRGVKIISMQTLLLTLLLIISLAPRLFFSIGFWLSMSGVFYIFLFLIHFKHLSKLLQFVLIPFWVYLLMLPYSLALFGNFSLYHPLSIIYTSLFTLFYPLSIFVHILDFGSLFDTLLEKFMYVDTHAVLITYELKYLVVVILLSFLSLYKKSFLVLLLLYACASFIYAIYNVA